MTNFDVNIKPGPIRRETKSKWPQTTPARSSIVNTAFAKNQLEKHGWRSGQGLGKEEHGIKEAIKVKVKKDTAGVGHNPGEEFTFHWWDHIFNKAANNIDVSNTEDGVQVKQASDFSVSNKKPLAKVLNNKQMLYGRFVKAATLNDGLETPQASGSDSDDDSDEDDESDVHTTISQLTDEDLLRICGGRTAHKGARHGIKMNGKLARIEQQDQILAAQSDSCSSSPAPKEKDPTKRKFDETDNDGASENKGKKRKKNKKDKGQKIDSDEELENLSVATINKKKKRKHETCNIVLEECVEDSETCTKRKKNKKDIKDMKKAKDIEVKTNDDDETGCNGDLERSKAKKKKKKKSKAEKPQVEDERHECNGLEICNESETSKKIKKSKKSKRKREDS